MFAGPAEQWGERLTHTYLGMWEDPVTAGPLRAILVSAFTNDQALDRLRAFLISTVLEAAASRLPSDNPGLRLGVAMSQLIGIALARHLIQAPAMCEQTIEELVVLVGPTIQNYLTGDLPTPWPSPGNE